MTVLTPENAGAFRPRGEGTSAERVALVAILLVAAFLRLHDIGRQSLWFDESATVRIVRQGFVDMFRSIGEGERIPPLHYVILWVWVRVFGHAEWSVRLPSALAGIGAVWTLFALTRHLFGVGAAVVAAVLLAVAPFQVEYAQEARSYSLMMLLSLASCLLFVRMLERPRGRADAAHVLATAAALYAHLYALFTLVAQAMALAFAWWKRLAPLMTPRRWVAANVGIAALFLPWLPTTLTWMRSVGSGFWVAPMTVDDVSAAYLAYAGGSIAMVLLLATLAVAGARYALRRSGIGFVLMLSLVTLPIFVPVIVSILTKPTFTPRYGIVAPAALYALAGCGVMALRNRAAQAVVVAALGLLSVNALRWTTVKPDWRGAVAHVERVARAGDYVVMNPRLSTFLYDQYAARSDVRRKGFDSGAIPLGLPLDDGVSVWFVFEPASFVAKDVLLRGGWQVRSAKRFTGLIVLELDD